MCVCISVCLRLCVFLRAAAMFACVCLCPCVVYRWRAEFVILDYLKTFKNAAPSMGQIVLFDHSFLVHFLKLRCILRQPVRLQPDINQYTLLGIQSLKGKIQCTDFSKHLNMLAQRLLTQPD